MYSRNFQPILQMRDWKTKMLIWSRLFLRECLKQDVRSLRRIFSFLTFLTPHFLVLKIRDNFRQMLKEFVCNLTSSTSLPFITLIVTLSSRVSGLKVPSAPPNAGIAQICSTHSAPWSTVLVLLLPLIKIVSSSETRETSWVFRGKGSKKINSQWGIDVY